jgi:uncharacterized protein YcnI
LLSYSIFNVNIYAHLDIPDGVDLLNPIAIIGKIIAVEWKNPHTTFHIDAEPISGGIKQVWTVPADEPNALLQRGLNLKFFPTMSGASLVIYKS